MKFNFFKKKSTYEIHKEKTDAELKSVMNLLWRIWWDEDSYFDMKDFLSKKVENAINLYISNLTYRKTDIDKLISDIVNEKINEKASYFFTEDISVLLKEKLEKIDLWTIRSSTTFEKFMQDFIKDNRAFIENKMVGIVESDEFLKWFSWDLENELRDIAIERIIKNA